VFLGAAVVALVAFGLLILLTRPAGPSAGTSPTPTALPTLSQAPAPTIAITVAPTTAGPPAPTAALPTSLPPRLTTPPSASP
jgi:hypothetical protein